MSLLKSNISECSGDFTQCESAKRIQLILNAYNIISDEKNESDDIDHLKNDANKLVNNISITILYSNVELLNDFNHLRYGHKMNDDSTQLNSFYKHLIDHNNTLKCDINNCQSAQRYYNRYNRLFMVSYNTKDAYSLNLLCKIHTYFIHSDDHIQDIALKNLTALNNKKQNVFKMYGPVNSKFVTTELHQCNYKEICDVLANNRILIKLQDLKAAFDSHGYDKQCLIHDLCHILVSQNEENVLLSAILINQLKQSDYNQRQLFYDTILFEYINKEELNVTDFIKILQCTASKIIPNIDCQKIETIAQTEQLNGDSFVQFKNSTKFALLFKTMSSWKKKPWAKIYRTINQWKCVAIKTVNPHRISTKCTSVNEMSNKDENKQEEAKYAMKITSNQDDIDYINQGTDDYLMKEFVSITNTTENTAISFLKQAEWNLSIAVYNYFGKQDEFDHEEQIDMHMKQDESKAIDGVIYNHGIEFWYWNQKRLQKRYVEKQYKNLKDEMLQFRQFTVNYWQNFIDECSIMIKTNAVRSILCNGNSLDIYEIPKDSSITLDHICAIKLYTDYSDLCNIFCQAFRLKKLSNNHYERIQSVQHRNKKIANWARLLMEAVQCFGKFMTGKTKYYRGINMEFMFKRFITKFNVPLSTTTSITRASEFTDGPDGLIMELTRYNEFISGFDCSVLSDFVCEKEILFFGSDAIFKLACIYQWHGKQWMGYRKYINQIQNILDIASGSIQWKRYNDMKDIIANILPDLYHNLEKLPPYIENLLNYQLKNMPREIEYDFRELAHQYQWVQDIFVKNNNIPNVANACNLFEKSHTVTFSMSKEHMMNVDCCRSIIADLLKLKNNEVVIQFTWKDLPRSMDDIAHTLSVSSLLFKEIDLKIQTDLLRQSISFCHSIDWNKILPPRASHPEHKQNKSRMLKTDIKGFAVLSRFVDSMSETYTNSSFVPDTIIVTIYKYIGGCTALIDVLSDFYRTRTAMSDFWQVKNPPIVQNEQDQYLSSLYDTSTSIVAICRMTLCEYNYGDMQGYKNMSIIEDIGLLTNTHAYFISGSNFEICREFLRRTKINELVQDNATIDLKIAWQLAQNLDLVDNNEFLEANILPRLIGLNKRAIVLNMWLSKIHFNSLASLFGICSISTGRMFYDLPNINDWTVNGKYVVKGKCTVLDLNGIEELDEVSSNGFRFVSLKPKYSEYTCEFRDGNDCDQWFDYFELIAENPKHWYEKIIDKLQECKLYDKMLQYDPTNKQEKKNNCAVM
eukprot:534619_1